MKHDRPLQGKTIRKGQFCLAALLAQLLTGRVSIDCAFWFHKGWISPRRVRGLRILTLCDFDRAAPTGAAGQ